MSRVTGPNKVNLPSHITASSQALSKIKRISERMKTSKQHLVVVGDSNSVGGVFNTRSWKEGSFPRLLDQAMRPLRLNVDGQSLNPQTQVIKIATMGNSYANSNSDTPWHNTKRKWIGQFLTFLGPFNRPASTMNGHAIFDNPSNLNRWFGFIVDRTVAGEDYEIEMTKACVRFYGRGNSDQGIGASTFATNPNGTDYSGTAYSGLFSTFTLSLVDITSIDLSSIPGTGWDNTHSACIAIKSVIDGLTPTASITIDPNHGSGASLPGFTSSFVTGMTVGKKWLVKLSVPDSPTSMGSKIEALILSNDDSAGYGVYDYGCSGNDYSTFMEWFNHSMDGNDGSPPFGGETFGFYQDEYIKPAFASKFLMHCENTYGLSGFYGANSWIQQSHALLGGDVLVTALMTNDLNSNNMPLNLYKKIRDINDQIVRIQVDNSPSEKIHIVVLPPCLMSNVGDNYRDYYFNDINHLHVRATYSEFVQKVKAAAALRPSICVVLDYQDFWGNIAPSVRKSRIGRSFYKRSSNDPTEILHESPETYLGKAAEDIANLFLNWGYRLG